MLRPRCLNVVVATTIVWPENMVTFWQQLSSLCAQLCRGLLLCYILSLERLLAEDVHERKAGGGDERATQAGQIEGDLRHSGRGHAKHCSHTQQVGNKKIKTGGHFGGQDTLEETL